MTKHFNNLSEAEAERLAVLIEECAVAEEEGDDPEHNRQMLERECGDVLCAIDILINSGDLSFLNIDSPETPR